MQLNLLCIFSNSAGFLLSDCKLNKWNWFYWHEREIIILFSKQFYLEITVTGSLAPLCVSFSIFLFSLSIFLSFHFGNLFPFQISCVFGVALRKKLRKNDANYHPIPVKWDVVNRHSIRIKQDVTMVKLKNANNSSEIVIYWFWGKKCFVNFNIFFKKIIFFLLSFD